jgi:very-short-patch-repair endonuclease
MKKPYPPCDVLVALAKEPSDFYIAQTQQWYRIPTSSRLPVMLRAQTARIIAFYFPEKFKELKSSIRFFAPITGIELVSRQQLFPTETPNSKSAKQYYKISFGPLQELPKPIFSYRPRFILFIPTTWEKFSQAEELNDLYHESPLEDKLWLELKRHNLPAERQVLLPTTGKHWICDFAFYCAKGKIDVECDGDSYHMHPDAVRYDKARNNEITAVAGWDILRFTTRNIEEELPQTVHFIKSKIDRLGGLHYAREGVVR